MKLHFSGKESLSIMWVCAWVGIVASGDSLTLRWNSGTDQWPPQPLQLTPTITNKSLEPTEVYSRNGQSCVSYNCLIILLPELNQQSLAEPFGWWFRSRRRKHLTIHVSNGYIFWLLEIDMMIFIQYTYHSLEHGKSSWSNAHNYIFHKAKPFNFHP